jgi:uncharacterized protein
VLYLDTSFLIPLFLPEATSDKIERFLGLLSSKAAIKADAQFAEATAESFVILLPTADDFDVAGKFLRRYKTGLRAGDALHLAIASNNRATAVYSLDKAFSAAGRRLGLKVRAGIRLRK